MKWSHIFNSRSETITAAACILAASTLISRLLGFIRLHLFAYFFGATDIYDMYVAAFRIPDLLFTLLVSGTLSAAFIPVFSDFLHKKKDEAWVLANNVLNILLFCLIVISFLLFFLAPYLVPLVVPGFDAAKTATTITLSRILLLQPIFLGLGSLFSRILHSLKRFVVVAIGPLLYNLGIIAGVLFFYQWWGVYGLIIGVVLGAFLHMAIQIPAIIMSGFSWQPIFDWQFSGFKRILRLAPPRTLSLLVAQINLFVITIIASTLGEGKLSIFNYANLLEGFPLAIFALSFATGAFPTLAQFVAQSKKEDFVHSLVNTLRQILFFLIPATVFTLVLRAQIVRVILGRGQFAVSWTPTDLTIKCLFYFALGLVAHGAFLLFSRAFWALRDTKTPFLVGLLGAGVNVGLSLYLAPRIGVPALALGFSAAHIVTALLLFIFLHFRLGFLEDFSLFQGVLKITLAALVAGLGAYGALHLLDTYVNMRTFVGIATQGLLAGLFGVIIYLMTCCFLKVQELKPFLSLIKKNLYKIQKSDV